MVGEGQSGRKVVTRHYLQGLTTSTIDTVIFPITPAATAHSLKVGGSRLLGFCIVINRLPAFKVDYLGMYFFFFNFHLEF